jgi:hypothetical protein
VEKKVKDKCNKWGAIATRWKRMNMTQHCVISYTPKFTLIMCPTPILNILDESISYMYMCVCFLMANGLYVLNYTICNLKSSCKVDKYNNAGNVV